MRLGITREEALAFRARWKAVNEATEEESRNTPPSVKLQQIAILMASVEALGWKERLEAEDEAVRERWQRLRALAGTP